MLNSEPLILIFIPIIVQPFEILSVAVLAWDLHPFWPTFKVGQRPVHQSAAADRSGHVVPINHHR
jgi:hypothetical protein